MSLDPTLGIAVFSDGSSYYKDKSGGWAWVALDAFDGVQSDSGFRSGVTNNQMELLAPTQALISLYGEYGECKILVYSDSEYVVLGCQDPNRARKKNKGYWIDLDDAISLHDLVEWEHVKGHAGHEYNELADELAGKARKSGNLHR